MPLDFIKTKTGSNSIDDAVKQQEQLSYFTQSSIQQEINSTYLTQWAERKFIGNDKFLNWVKAVVNTENFLSFFKYFRQPLASAKIVNNKLKDPLARVFFAEDSYFKYNIKGQDVNIPEELEAEKFDKKIFNALLYNYNDILVHDLTDINTPFREIISIKNVVAIDSKDSVINRLAYTATVEIEGEDVKGFLFMDDKAYIFYNKELDTILLNIPHDLGVCPADYISRDAFKDKDVVRKSIFSYVRPLFEELDFLKTLQRMQQVNGVVPVVTELKATVINKNIDTKPTNSSPMSANEIRGQKGEFQSEAIGANSNSPLAAGTRIKIDPNIIRKENRELDMEVLKNFLNFFYIPIEALDHLNKRIKEIEVDIIVSVLGDFSEANEAQKNEMQVSKSFENKRDKLRDLSSQLTRIRKLSDHKLLSLKHGTDSVMVDLFYGSDFFLESQTELYSLFKLSPNPIERKNILLRLSQNRNKFNPDKGKREKILYNLMPFVADEDFEKAVDRNTLDDEIFLYQTQFNYWIGIFEATHGDVVFFWNIIDGEDTVKLLTINNLIINLIKEYNKEHKVDTTV